MRVIIIGAGIMGLSTAWALGRGGHAVTVVEQYDIPNWLGSSVDQHRLIRYPYGRMAGYAAMVGPAYAAWERLWLDLGAKLYIETGTLAVGTPRHSWLHDSAATLARAGIAVEWLAMDELARRFPLLGMQGLEQAFHLPTGGVLLAAPIIEHMAHHLARTGTTLLTRSRARRIDADRARVTLDDGRVLDADRLVVAAGPWVARLLPELARRVTPSRQVICYLEPPAASMAAWAAMPMVLDIDPERGSYLVPPVAGTSMKVGDHSFSLTGDPDRDRDATAGEAAQLIALCRDRLAGFEDFRTVGARTCFYTVEQAERFIVEPAGRAAWVISGCSGHGFKFGPLLGEAMAETLLGRRDEMAMTRWAAGEIMPIAGASLT